MTSSKYTLRAIFDLDKGAERDFEMKSTIRKSDDKHKKKITQTQ